MVMKTHVALLFGLSLSLASALAKDPPPKYPAYPSETPSTATISCGAR